MNCPECNGEGATYGFCCPGFNPITLPCGLCKGQKVISEEQAKWVEYGANLREARKAARITLREGARLRGILASELSDIERGVVNNLDLTSVPARGEE